MSEEAANNAAREMKIKENPGRSILELYPGPGQLTRSMALAGAKKVVTLEPVEVFQESLKSLELASEGRIQNFQMNPAVHPYDELLEIESKDRGEEGRAFPGLKPQPWDKVYPDLALVASIPNSLLGEKLIHDILISAIERMGIFQLGRVEMYMFCSKAAIKRLVAPPGTPSRNRVTIMAEIAAEITPMMAPGLQHFYLPYDYQLLKLVPHEKPKLDTSFEILDFCLRSLFTSKAFSLKKNIKLLGPGAEILLSRLSFDTDIKVKHMTWEQFNEIAAKFEQWPLRPTTLYDDMILHERRGKR
ncbi:hypothetical protein EMPS_01964 [Entomortierella parvispora]|uniref:rRNA adenine N(6)-methyltransferase n=1 Tax=Entomortierella parvispora TaxID=205924 RepID=A0A9P3H4J5_9FUNG|nr:hypothetical protein EMPS_01964 [Entomortierella parvispora]